MCVFGPGCRWAGEMQARCRQRTPGGLGIVVVMRGCVGYTSPTTPPWRMGLRCPRRVSCASTRTLTGGGGGLAHARRRDGGGGSPAPKTAAVLWWRRRRWWLGLLLLHVLPSPQPGARARLTAVMTADSTAGPARRKRLTRQCAASLAGGAMAAPSAAGAARASQSRLRAAARGPAGGRRGEEELVNERNRRVYRHGAC